MTGGHFLGGSLRTTTPSPAIDHSSALNRRATIGAMISPRRSNAKVAKFYFLEQNAKNYGRINDVIRVTHTHARTHARTHTRTHAHTQGEREGAREGGRERGRERGIPREGGWEESFYKGKSITLYSTALSIITVTIML